MVSFIKQKFSEGRYTSTDLDDTVKALGIPVLRHWRNSAEYDCNLTAIIFLRIIDDLITLGKIKKRKSFPKIFFICLKNRLRKKFFN